jgi:hypothetical protein
MGTRPGTRGVLPTSIPTHTSPFWPAQTTTRDPRSGWLNDAETSENGGRDSRRSTPSLPKTPTPHNHDRLQQVTKEVSTA